MIFDRGCSLLRDVSMVEFLGKPGIYVREAAEGEFVKVRMADGFASVIIDEAEWAMLCQALKLCTEHPEWLREPGVDV